MKKQLLALSLIATSGLLAQDSRSSNMSMQQCGTCSTCNCTPCCCKPCTPKPKKCIDCECYTPMFYDLQCDCGFFASVDFLYWYARETNLSYALQVNGAYKDANDTTSDVAFAPSTYKNLNTKWDPGFRIGLGWNSSCDGWDYYLTWTYMHNTKKNTTTVPAYALNGTDIFLPDAGQEALVNPWVNPSLFPNNASIVHFQTFQEVSARWKLKNWNVIDLELGRKFWLSPCLAFRPYVGLRGAWDRVTFKTVSTFADSTDTSILPLVFQDKFKTSMWGVGMVGGFQPTWYYCQNFALFGNVEAGLLWGEFQVKKRENYQSPDPLLAGDIINWNPAPSKNNFFQMTAIIDLAIGLRWEERWCCDQYLTALDVGWEHHIWFDQNHRNRLIDPFVGPSVSTGNQGVGFRTFAEATGNLGLGGLVVRLRADF